ncbi:hypothetical protein NQ314_004422 [Rhamnusium bicolor]|uniref:Uncharacterized protein n=1 Tax=Rhamnusium bicolor TaxID=1586634 RepID=A0AAV8ZJF2_9CUCU|nr:hypothetical protein NQ314_004422 [Rhamnusium bicolor]
MSSSSSSPNCGTKDFQVLIVLSSPRVIKLSPLGVYDIPLTIPLCATNSLRHTCCGISQILTSPSKAPLIKTDKRLGCFEIHETPSLWPSKPPINGFANTFSSFTAFKALVYSLAASKGCKAGS